jgi:chromate transporter
MSGTTVEPAIPVGAPEPGSRAPSGVGPWELFRTFFVIGLTAFGMAILQNIRSVPVKEGWMAPEDIDEGLALVQLYPGAMMVDLVAYVGYRTRRIRGALAATAGFVAPSLVLMLGLSWLYRAYGGRAGVQELVVGLDAIVVGVVTSVALDFAARHSRGRVEAVLGLAAFGLGVEGVNLLWAVLGGLVAGAALLRGDPDPGRAAGGAPGEVPGVSWRRVGLALSPGLVVAAGAIVAALASGALAALVADMAKIGTVAFGNGATILPVLQQDVVGAHHWLSQQAFGAGVGFGQVTPGPFLITASFVGFQVAGWWGGILGAVAIFAPSVAMTLVAAEVYPSLRHLAPVRGAIRGIMAVFVGLLATVVLSLGRQVLPVPAALVLAAAALVAVRSFKWNLLAVFGAGLAAWGIYLVLGGSA